MENRLENSFNCFVCGVSNKAGLCLEFTRIERGVVSTHVIFGSEFQDYPGFAHCGLLSTVLVETAGRSFMTEGDSPPKFVTTQRMSVRYLKPVPTGMRVTATGRQISTKNNLWVAEATIQHLDGAVLAKLIGTFKPIPPRALRGLNLVAGGWKVYSESEFPSRF